MPAAASPIAGNSPSIGPMELRTVAQIRNAAAAKTNQSVKGAAPMTAMNSLRRLAEEAHMKEEQGEQRAALYKFVQVGVLLQFVQDSHEYKQELQRGRHGALYQMMQDFNKGPFEAMVKSVTNLQRALLQEERAEAELSGPVDGGSEYDSGSLNRRSGGSLAERLKQLQGSGIQADLVGRRIQRPPSQNFRPQSPPVALPSRGPTPAPRGQTPAPRGQTPAPRGQTPAPRGQTPAPRGPTPGPFSIPRRSSLSYVAPLPPASPGPNGISSSYTRSTMSAMSPTTAPGTSPRQFVPVASFGPPSPTHSNGSSPEEDDIQVPRVHLETPIRSPTDFSRTFPPIDELNEREPSLFPSVPSHAPGSKPSPNGVNVHAPNGVPWKQKAFPSLNMEPRPASTPINIKRQSGGARPTTPGYMNGSPQSSYGNNYPQGSPRTNGFVSTEPTQHPHVDLPITNAITPQKLNSLLETRGLNILLLDVRSRDEFDRERINHDAIVCVEPLILSRQGINSSMIEGAQVISPSTEQVLFKNRSRFDLIIMYDQKSTTLGSANSSMSTLSRAIFENEFHRPLKKPPMLLIGGLKAWKGVIGEDGILKRLSPTSSTPSSSLPAHGNVIPPNATGSSTSTASEEETFLYDMPTAEAKYPPVDQVQPQSTGSDISTETPGSNKLTRRPLPKPQLAPTLQVPNYPPSIHSPHSPHAPTLVSAPGTGTSIQYPSPFSASSPVGPTPPQAASVNQYRRRNDFVEQKPYTGAIQPGKPINYPHLSAGNVLAPPPAAATSTTTRQEPRTRLAQPSPAQPSPLSVPLIPSDYPVVYWAGNEIGISGLKNLGNTCYMNAVLQCLSATSPFARFFINGTWQKAVNMLNPLGTKGKFTEGYARLLVDMWRADTGALVPYPFRKTACTYAPQFADSNQHDAQEFLIFLLDGLHEDLNRVLQRVNVETRPEREAELEALSTQIASEQEWHLYRMRNNSIVVDYFQGQFRNRMECMTCHKTSTTYNTFMHLSLHIPDGRHSPRVSLQQCLDAFVQTEVMDKNDAWNCPNCKALRKATKVLTLCRLPPILLIHLKRFSFKGPFTEKLETLVDFPLTNLDLTNYMPPPLPIGADKSAMGLYGKPQLLTPDDPRRQIPPYKYDLFSVTNHYGTLSSGHYTAYVSSGGGWKYCDDSRISRAEKSAVVTKAAYILFYKRTH